MAWDDIKTDGSTTLPAAEYNMMITAIKNQATGYVIYKSGSNYITKKSDTGNIIYTGTSFVAAAQAASDDLPVISPMSSAKIQVIKPSTAIVIDGTIDFTGKAIFFDGGWAEYDFHLWDGVCFKFDGTPAGENGALHGGIENCFLYGSVTNVNSIFVTFNWCSSVIRNLLVARDGAPGGYATRRIYAGIRLISDCYGNIIDHCYFEAILPIYVGPVCNATNIHDCDFGYLAADYGIVVAGGGPIVICNNYFENIKTAISVTGGGSIMIYDNFITQITTCAISVSGIFNVDIHGNHILLNATGAKGITTGGYYSPTITGNTFYAGQYNDINFIYTTGIQRSTITGNIFNLDSATPTGCVGIKGTGDSTANTITGNVFYCGPGTVATGIDFTGFYYSTITGNCFYRWGTPINLTSKVGTVIENNYGYKNENWGTSTGTGSQQTIAHGLAAIPTCVMLCNKETGANPYQSATADATNIYILAVNNQDYSWFVRF